jgi:hypothetical protein
MGGCIVRGGFGRSRARAGWSCTCGFYATKNLAPFPKAILVDLPSEDGVERGWIFGRVDLAGKIVEHDSGYRAQRARIAELNPVEGDEPNSTRLAALFGVPIGNPVPVVTMPLPPAPPWSPPDGPSTLGSESGIGFRTWPRSPRPTSAGTTLDTVLEGRWKGWAHTAFGLAQPTRVGPVPRRLQDCPANAGLG